MLTKDELEKIAERIPAKSRYAVIASWADARDKRRAIEADGLAAYIVEPAGPYADGDGE